MRLILVLFTILLLLTITFLVVVLVVFTPGDRRLFISFSESLVVDGKNRHYKIVNASPKNTDPQPLIIGLHGYRDRAEWFAAYSGLHLLAEQEDAILALPSGLRNSWNGTFCCGWAWQNNAADAAFVLKMIEAIEQNYTVDASRIYIVGFSNGGILAQKLLNDAPDIFTAGAAVMSGVGDKNTLLDISNATAPLLLVNGTADAYVPLKEMQPDVAGFTFLPAFDSADIWAEQYDLTGNQATTEDIFTRYTWKNDTNRQLEQLIYETSHRWPSWRLWTLPNEVPRSTQVIWEFLSSHQS